MWAKVLRLFIHFFTLTFSLRLISNHFKQIDCSLFTGPFVDYVWVKENTFLWKTIKSITNSKWRFKYSNVHFPDYVIFRKYYNLKKYFSFLKLIQNKYEITELNTENLKVTNYFLFPVVWKVVFCSIFIEIIEILWINSLEFWEKIDWKWFKEDV